jgi:hypothetical protein
LWFQGFVSGAAFGIEELQLFLKGIGVGRVPQERAFATDVYKFLVLQFLQAVRMRGIWDFQL